MILPVTEKNINQNMKLIMKKAKFIDDKINYYAYNYILLRILHIQYISNNTKDAYQVINQFLRKILSQEGQGKCKMSINYLLNKSNKSNKSNQNKHLIHTKLYSIMNQEIILI